MAKKKKEEKEETKPAGEKFILCELVDAFTEPNWVIVGALSRAGLLEQYNHELEVYGYEIIEPSITVDDLSKIIKEFLGE